MRRETMELAKTTRKTILALAAIASISTGLIATQASAAGYSVGTSAVTTNFAGWDRLNIRSWPAAHSRQVAQIRRGQSVWVERCILKSGTDWCKISKGWKRGWVNGKFIRHGGYTFAHRHPWF